MRKILQLIINQMDNNNKINWFLHLADYNEAYYRWLYCPEKDKQMNKERLDKVRSLWFNS